MAGPGSYVLVSSWLREDVTMAVGLGQNERADAREGECSKRQGGRRTRDLSGQVLERVN